MKQAQASQTIEQYIAYNWAVTKYHFSNTQPRDMATGELFMSGNAPYVKFEILYSNTGIITVGRGEDNCVRRSGMLICYISYLVDMGERVYDDICDSLCNLFLNKHIASAFGNIRFYTQTQSPKLNVLHGWRMASSSFLFEYEI